MTSKGKKIGIIVGVILGIAAIIGGVVAAVKIIKYKQQESGGTGTTIENPTPNPTPSQEEIAKSKELEEELKNDVEDKKPEEIDTKINDKQNELDKAEQELENLKNSGASAEEIAKAEEKQQEAEKQLEDAKEEQNYWTITSTIKDLYNNKFSNSQDYPNSYIRNINGISYNNFYMVVEADIVSKDANNLLSQHRVVMQIRGDDIQNFEKSNQLSQFFQNCHQIKIFTEIHEEISEFENNYYNNYLENPDRKLEAANTIYNKEGDLNEIVFKINDDQQVVYPVCYQKFDLSSMSKHFSNEAIISMVNSGDERVGRYMSFLKDSIRCQQLNYDWEKATIEYKGQKTEQEKQSIH